ncbi:PLP-dependent aminotransferase family protein [Allokutzneria multivorans]|uniref:PLP-dependent aminotransferase family protein n=1 Tax=Allokutzneria multivorans TaxID=1142134 RepID=A0ABP7RLU4_9PSEU
MAQNWTTLRELLLPALDGSARATERALRAAVRSGGLRAGTRLPSSRDLATQLGVSRGTVTAAYEQLIAEGYLISKRGSGTRVANAVNTAVTPQDAPAAPIRQWRYDLRSGLPALGMFPRAAWLAAARSSLAELPDAALGYPDPAGLAELREELVGYLGRVRSVVATPNDVLITHGASEGMALLANVLHRNGHTSIAVEHPSHEGQANLLRSHGLNPVPIAVDEHGLRVADLEATDCRVALVTSAHQFPLGVALSPERRHALLAWARARDGVVIEDDYDAEHRYDRPAVGAMQAMDPARVVYLGSVSKTLAPALRLGWLVAPSPITQALVTRKLMHDLGCGPLPQATFARFLREGGYDRHLRRTRLVYRERRDALLSAIRAHFPSWEVVGIAAGLHLVVRLPERMDDDEAQDRLAARGIHALALSKHSWGLPSPYPGLVLGYAALSPDRLRAAVAEMGEALGNNPNG